MVAKLVPVEDRMPMMVILPDRLRCFLVEVSGVVDIFQLHVLLADALLRSHSEQPPHLPIPKGCDLDKQIPLRAVEICRGGSEGGDCEKSVSEVVQGVWSMWQWYAVVKDDRVAEAEELLRKGVSPFYFVSKGGGAADHRRREREKDEEKEKVEEREGESKEEREKREEEAKRVRQLKEGRKEVNAGCFCGVDYEEGMEGIEVCGYPSSFYPQEEEEREGAEGRSPLLRMGNVVAIRTVLLREDPPSKRWKCRRFAALTSSVRVVRELPRKALLAHLSDVCDLAVEDRMQIAKEEQEDAEEEEEEGEGQGEYRTS